MATANRRHKDEGDAGDFGEEEDSDDEIEEADLAKRVKVEHDIFNAGGGLPHASGGLPPQLHHMM